MNIFEYVSQEDIFNKYFHEVNLKARYINTLRPGDKNPGCFYQYRNGKLYFTDYANADKPKMDCIDIVMKLYNISAKEAFEVIKKDFNLSFMPTSFKGDIITPSKIKDYESIPKKTTYSPSEIIVVNQDFKQIDIDYWNQYSITVDTLNKFNVKSCFKAYIDKQLYHIWIPQDPMYSYCEKDKFYKLYRPKASKNRKWRTNISGGILEGYKQLPNSGELLIITKSLKDVMCLYQLGYNSVGVRSETTLMSPNAMNILRDRFEKIIILFDNDDTGIQSIDKIKQEYGINGFYIEKKLDSKDVSDLIKNTSMDFAKEYIKNEAENICK